MALKVFDLQCEHGHQFEGWFRSHEDYADQLDSQMLTCPVCDSAQVERIPSAPRLNMGHGSTPATPPSTKATPPTPAQVQAAVMTRLREIVHSAENVGERFAQEARRMHEGESEQRPIRGVATREEREELSDEGISVFEVPDFLDDERLN